MSFLSIVLIAAILAPTVIKLSHAIFEHENIECLDVITDHVHKIELDCDFQKFKFSAQTYSIFIDYTIIESFEVSIKNINKYSFLSKYQKLHFSLRGPPIS